MDMSSSETSNWFFDYDLMDNIPVPAGEFPAPPATEFAWPSQLLSCSPNASVEADCSFGESDNLTELGSRKRLRSKSCGVSCSKACREKLRRDRLNGRFLELASVLDSGRLPKTDKAAILSDAVRALTQLRSESKKLKESIDDLQNKIKELKAEKYELRDEKQRLKEDKEKLEQLVIAMSAQTGYSLPHTPAISTACSAQCQASGNKFMPFINCPSHAMWQLMSHSTVDTSHDHVLRPPIV